MKKAGPSHSDYCASRNSSPWLNLVYDDLQLAKYTPYQFLDCDIFHNRQVPDTLRSTRKIEIKNELC